MRLKYKFMLIFTIFAILIISSYSSFVLYYQVQSLEKKASHTLDDIQDKFNTLEEQEINLLGSTLEVITRDNELKRIFLEGNREELFQYGQPLFQQLKNKYNITHFYFIQPDGHCFVRLHNADIYNDLITRFTFWNANETKELSSGLELGKTAFALRVVVPYYNGSELIGYLELGEEIERFLKNLKGNTINEHSIIVEKQYLDEEKWNSVKEIEGVRNNWDDLQNHVILSDTIGKDADTDKLLILYFNSENAEKIANDELEFQVFEHNRSFFTFGGFPIIDAGNRKVGMIFTILDISDQMEAYQQNIASTLFITIIIISVAIFLSIMLSRSLSKPIIKLEKASYDISKGKLDTKIDIKSNDEIGRLARAFEKMTVDLKSSRNKIEKYNKNLEKTVNQRTKEVQTLLNQKEEFINQLGHDLKNPLTPITRLLPKVIRDTSNKKNLERLEIVNRNIYYIKNLILNTLKLAKLNTSKNQFNFQETNISDIINEALLDNKFLFEENGIKLNNLTKNNIFANVDNLQIREVFNNLFSNAVKYIEGEGLITIDSIEKDNNFLFSIKDNGIGMNKDQIRQLFDEFYKADESRHDFYSTGLGLTITKKIIGKHGGRIWAESNGLGKGSIFYFTIPKKLNNKRKDNIGDIHKQIDKI